MISHPIGNEIEHKVSLVRMSDELPGASAARQKSGRLLAPLRGAATPPRPSSFSRGFTPNPAPAPRSPSAAMESQQPPALLPASGTSNPSISHAVTDPWRPSKRAHAPRVAPLAAPFGNRNSARHLRGIAGNE